MIISLIGLFLMVGSGYYLLNDIMAIAQGYPADTLLAGLTFAAYRMGMPAPGWQAFGVWLSPFVGGAITFLCGMNTNARQLRRERRLV